MMMSDSTSEAAKERKTRALSVRSEITTLNRKQSLMIRILALIDGHCRAMRAVLLEVQVVREGCAWLKDSSFCNRVEINIHVSAPNVTVHAKTLRKSAILISRYRSQRHERQFILFSRFFAHKVRIPS